MNIEQNGMTARILKSIFSYQNAEEVKVLVSFIEIYKDQAFDLLAENRQDALYNKGKFTVKYLVQILSWVQRKNVTISIH